MVRFNVKDKGMSIGSQVHLKHTHAYRLSGGCCKQAPILVSLTLFIWSITLFKRSGYQIMGGTNQQQVNCPPAGIVGDTNGGGMVPRRTLQEQMNMGGAEGEVLPRPLSTQQHPTPRLMAMDVPSLSIFCAPKPYTGEPDDPQRRALISWLRLSSSPKIILLGEDASFRALEREFAGRVFVEPSVDQNFYGVPLFHSMVARAQSADTDASMIINGDIILLNDLIPAMQKVASNFDNWVLTAARWDLGVDFPFDFEKHLRVGGAKGAAFEAEVRRFTREHGSLHTYGGVDFWMWNNSPMPLHAGEMPPFAFGRGKYDNWLTHEIISTGLRQVIDASDSTSSIHVAHSYAHVVEDNSTAKVDSKLNFWSTRKKSSWELFSNIHLAQAHGTYTNQKGTALHVPWRLTTCYEPAANNMCLLKRVRPANCSCEYGSAAMATQSDPKLQDNKWTCGSVSVDKAADFTIKTVATPASVPGLPHTMEQLLPMVAKEVNGESVVILVAVTNGYAEMLMNFVCSLRKIGLGENLVVAALDEDLYRFAFTQGLAVYYEQASDGLKNIDQASCAFGTQCFRQFTKLKSRAVLRVLKAGFSVLWTDVDIVWYSDPLPHLMSFGPGTFPIQSNEPNETIPGTGIRRINSGFYFARSDAMTIEAFEAITAHAALTKLSEQPSFYDILCGEKGELLVKSGKEECVWTNGLRTIFLDRARYPNGAVHKFWSAPDVTQACRARGCIILHNNWISGKDAKKDRLVKNGYWHYDPNHRMCTHNWHPRFKWVLRAEDVPRTEEAQAEAEAAAAAAGSSDEE